ncbi:MAG TPA: TlyA family RNA methyltransferase [Thermodesulfobacteriota bacterium]|nr:TlyA family RNA methyltransferase [Thermodesulfobacteriota bacterium]
MKKIRLDMLLVERGLAESVLSACPLIMAGKVLVDGRVADKAGAEVSRESEVSIKADAPFVGRGGLKLEGALKDFDVIVRGLVAMDVGSSTGGFTDCLLKNGVTRVYAVDVGKGVIDDSLRRDPRVCLLEGRNIRHLEASEVGEKIDIATIDVSFISLKKVIPKLKEFLKPDGRVLALIKPQFEAGKKDVGKGGVVRDPLVRQAVVEDIKAFSGEAGFKVLGVSCSKIRGAKGNAEFWIYFTAEN